MTYARTHVIFYNFGEFSPYHLSLSVEDVSGQSDCPGIEERRKVSELLFLVGDVIYNGMTYRTMDDVTGIKFRANGQSQARWEARKKENSAE